MERIIDATTTIRAPVTAASDVLQDDPGTAFGHVGAVSDRRRRQFPVRLVATVGTATAVEHAVMVDVGRPHADGDVVTVPVSWHPTGSERLLPSFEGELELRPGGAGRTQLVLRGTYVVPLGRIGRFGDVLVGRRIARQSAAEFLERIARSLDDEIDRRNHSVLHRPAPYPMDLREHAGSGSSDD